MGSHKKRTYRVIFIVAKLVLILGIVFFIFLKLKDEDNFNERFLSSITEALKTNGYILVAVLLLMPVNWFLEAKKWQILSTPIAALSIANAFKGVLAGLSIGFVTPHGIGAYIGRVLFIDAPNRGKLVGSILVSRLFQLLATLIFGSIGVSVLLGNSFLLAYILIICCVVITVLLILNLNINFNRKWINKVTYYVDIVKIYSAIRLLSVFALSCLRYLVFAVQFVLVLTMFVSIDLYLKVAGVTWIFLSKSILPTFNFLSDLGIREFSAIYFFDKFQVPLIPVLSASLLLWSINILTPTLIGAPLVMKLKLRA